jgi:two-component system chemotaxis response regulator CheB
VISRHVSEHLADSRLPASDDALHARLPVNGGPGATRPAIIVIGASTGGPQALETVVQGLGGTLLSRTAVLVVLHMPPEFVEIVAQHVGRLSGCPTHVAANRSVVEPGHIYLSPGDVHLKVVRQGSSAVLMHSLAPPENFCRPSVDVLFRSAAETFGSATLALMLSGMGHDGLNGAKAIVEAGGRVVAQDEKTSAVWGMPGAVVAAGLASAVLPIQSVAGHVGIMLRRPAARGWFA